MQKTKTALLLMICCLLTTATAESELRWFENICHGKENILKLNVFVQDVRGGPSATVYTVTDAPITSSSPTSFGQIHVVDNLVTAEPDIKSAVLGRAQGLARELAVVGGTGVFRFARGYAVTRTHSNDAAADYSVLQYTFYVTHYGGASTAAV